MYKVKDITFKQQDEYERKNIAKNIYHSISSGEFYSPCLLDGQWGSGKTEFCHKLYHYIIERNSADTSEEKFTLVPIYINVFNAERINNPFLSLMGGLVGSTCNEITVPKSFIETASKILSTEIALKPIGIGIAKDITGLLLSKIKEYAPQASDAVIEQITNGLDQDINNGLLKNAFEEVNKLDKQYQNFSTELENFATKETPIIFIIDELDRCRPNFAIQFLECIKHFFNVENVYFLLSCNVDQLIASINHLYGERINGENYLEKFFEDKIVLKNNSANQEANIKILSSFHDFSFLQYFNKDIVDFIFNTTTLREQHKISNKYLQIQKILERNDPIKQSLHRTLGAKANDVIFALAYLITHQNKTFTTLNLLVESEIFGIMINSYCINELGVSQPSSNDISQYTNLYQHRIMTVKDPLNEIIKTLTYS